MALTKLTYPGSPDENAENRARSMEMFRQGLMFKKAFYYDPQGTREIKDAQPATLAKIAMQQGAIYASSVPASSIQGYYAQQAERDARETRQEAEKAAAIEALRQSKEQQLLTAAQASWLENKIRSGKFTIKEAAKKQRAFMDKNIKKSESAPPVIAEIDITQTREKKLNYPQASEPAPATIQRQPFESTADYLERRKKSIESQFTELEARRNQIEQERSQIQKLAQEGKSVSLRYAGLNAKIKSFNEEASELQLKTGQLNLDIEYYNKVTVPIHNITAMAGTTKTEAEIKALEKAGAKWREEQGLPPKPPTVGYQAPGYTQPLTEIKTAVDVRGYLAPEERLEIKLPKQEQTYKENLQKEISAINTRELGPGETSTPRLKALGPAMTAMTAPEIPGLTKIQKTYTEKEIMPKSEAEATFQDIEFLSVKKLAQKAGLEKKLREAQVRGIEPASIAIPALAGAGMGAIAGAPAGGVGAIPGAIVGGISGAAAGLAGEFASDITYIETGDPMLSAAAGIGAGITAGGLTSYSLSKYLGQATATSSRIAFEAEKAPKPTSLEDDLTQYYKVRPRGGIVLTKLKSGKEIITAVHEGPYFDVQVARNWWDLPAGPEAYSVGKAVERNVMLKYPQFFDTSDDFVRFIGSTAAQDSAQLAPLYTQTTGQYMGTEFMQVGAVKPVRYLEAGKEIIKGGEAGYRGFYIVNEKGTLKGVPYAGLEGFESWATTPEKIGTLDELMAAHYYEAAGTSAIGKTRGIQSISRLGSTIKEKVAGVKGFVQTIKDEMTNTSIKSSSLNTLYQQEAQALEAAKGSAGKAIETITSAKVSETAIKGLAASSKYAVSGSALALGLAAGTEKLDKITRIDFAPTTTPIKSENYKTGTLAALEMATTGEIKSLSKQGTITIQKEPAVEIGLDKVGTLEIAETKIENVPLVIPRETGQTKTGILAETGAYEGLERTPAITPKTATRLKTATLAKLGLEELATIPQLPKIPPGSALFLSSSSGEGIIPFLGAEKAQGYDVQLKVRGKWKNASGKQSLKKDTANALGQYLADLTAARTYRIQESTKPITQKSPAETTMRGFKFYPKKGTKDTFIEKTAFAIDSPGEKKQITEKGLQALRSRFFARKARSALGITPTTRSRRTRKTSIRSFL